MELDLQSLFGLHVHSCTYWLRPRKPSPPPRIWAHIRGRYCSYKIDDISLWPHDSMFLARRWTRVKLPTFGQLKWPPLVGRPFVSSSLIGPFDAFCSCGSRSSGKKWPSSSQHGERTFQISGTVLFVICHEMDIFLEGLKVLTSTFYLCNDGFQGLLKTSRHVIQNKNKLFICFY